jgi:hypothetical protein
MTTEMMMIIAQENLEAHLEKKQEKENLKGLISPLQIWITRWDHQSPGVKRLGFYSKKGQ